MRKLSSSMTVYYKRVLPLVWISLLAAAVGMAWLDERRHETTAEPWLLLLGVGVALVIGMAIYFGMLHGLADEVAMDESSLFVRRGGEEGRIALADVDEVSCTRLTNPRRIVLTLHRDSRFGRRLAFVPATPLTLLGRLRPDPVAAELTRCVAAARQSR